MSFLGDSVLKGKETLASASLSSKKVIGLYFSAHWCGPCRGFTPQLVKWYENFKASSAHKDELEIVFVSSDRDQSSFDEYYGEMPWHALPYPARETKDELSQKYKVRGIPTLVFADADGNVITKDGRAIVGSDPEGARFPWAPKSLKEILGQTFVSPDGKSFGPEALEGKTVGLYFSAHWCPPCRQFTPQLAATYKKLKAAGKNFEIVFVSSDRDQSAFDEYHREMPWLAAPFADRARKDELSTYFEVSGIPTFVVLGADGKVINGDGRSAVAADPEGADFPWEPKALVALDEDTASALNEHPVVVVFTDGKDASVEAAKATLAPIAEREKAAAKAAGRPQIFFMYSVDNSEDGMVRDFAKVGDASPRIVHFNIPEQHKALPASHDLTPENVQAFVDSIVAKKATKVGIRE